ncbi:unnamed protein product [Penicillium olsonii]|nr:unnamed protein product [Penicillium olsonii]CAG7934621.1 unnamed protein product [Penicillium olsonii]
MDQSHTRAIEALQPFIHLAQSNSASSPRFIANLITNVTSSPQTYVFGELLGEPAVQALRSPEHSQEFGAYLTLLEVFAWGTYSEYQGKILPRDRNTASHSRKMPDQPDRRPKPETNRQYTAATPGLPKLNPEQTLKLRLLSLLTLCTKIKPLTYSALMEALAIPTKAELESLVTTAIYASMITARLSPASNPPSVSITAVAPLRDVCPTSIPLMVKDLRDWSSRCDGVVADLEAEIALIKSNAVKRAAKSKTKQDAIEEALKKRQDGGPWGRNRRGGARLGAGAGGSKRDAGNIEEDDGFFDTTGGGGSRMDIDEDYGPRGANRQPKRVLGRKS